MEILTKIGYGIGGLIFIGFFWRYFVIYSDASQGLLYMMLGVIIIGMSWIYEIAKGVEDKSKRNDIRLTELGEHYNDTLDSLKVAGVLN